MARELYGAVKEGGRKWEGSRKGVGRDWEEKRTGCGKVVVAKEVLDREGSVKGKELGM